LLRPAPARYTPLSAEPGVERPDHASGLSRAVVCLLAGHLLLGLGHVALLPPWEGFDETGHYSYIQELADRGEVPRLNQARMSAEVEAYARRAPLPYASAPPFTREGALTYGAFFAGSAESVAHAGAFVHGRPGAPRRYVAGREMNWLSMHPPLYYLALTPVYLATRQLSWAAHLMSLRLTSYLLAWAALVVGVWACATRAGWTGEDGVAASRWAMLGIALWPVLVPSWFPEMARLGNDSLSTLILAGGWVVTVRANGPAPSLGSALTLGTVLAAGCLTKLYFLAVAVAFLGFWLWRAWRAGGATALASAARRLVVALLVMVAVAGWWYVANWREYGVALASVEILQQQGAGGLVGAVARLSPAAAAKGAAVFVATLAWPGTWSLVRPPTAVIAPMVAIVLLGAGAYATTLRRRATAVPWLPAWLAAWVLLAFGYHGVVRLAATGQGQPGHYLHFLALALGVALGLGLRAGWPCAAFRWLVAGLVGYSLLFGVAVSWAQVMLFAGWLVKAGPTNVYRLPESLPPLLGVPDALTRLAALAYPGLGAVAWVLGGLLVLAGVARGLGSGSPGREVPEPLRGPSRASSVPG
jgi:hypothetical protein